MVAVSYYPALLGGFVWDDEIFVRERAVHAWSGLWSIWFSPDDIERERHYWPIVYSTFWLEHKLWGLDPFGYHLVNVLLYMVNVLLLWTLLRRLAVPGAWAVAAVFAVHPMHVESVAWVMGRKDLLSGLFYMAAALCWTRSIGGVGTGRTDPPAPKESPSTPWRGWLADSIRVPHPGPYLAALGLFVAAMLSKSVAVTLPVAFAIMLWWKQGQITRTDVLRIAPFFLVALCIAVADWSYYRSGREFALDYSLPERVLIAARAVWFYAVKLAWPADLAIVYPLWEVDAGDPLAWGGVIAAVVVAALLWHIRHRLGRGPLAGVLFFAVTLSPMLGFVDFAYMRYSFVADRYAYLAGVGVVAVLIGAAVRGEPKLPNLLRIGTACVLVAVLAVFGRMTWDRAGLYRDNISFYTHIISINPEVRSIHRNLALTLLNDGRPTEALAAARVEVERWPGSGPASNTVGVALLALGRLDEAEENFRRALELDPDNVSTYQNMAETRRLQGRFADSISWYRRALDIAPRFGPAREGIGKALKALVDAGRPTEALAASRIEVERHPDSANAHNAVGIALLALDRLDEAGDSFRRALELDSLSGSAAQNMAEVQGRQGRFVESISWYRRALDIDPESGPAYAGMGKALFHLGRYEEAGESLARAVSLSSDAEVIDVLQLLAEALRKQRRYEEAVEAYRRVLDIDPAYVPALEGVGYALFPLKRYEEAVESLTQAVSLQPPESPAAVDHFFLMGQALEELGRMDAAAEHYESAFEINPRSAKTLNSLAALRFRQQRHEEALRLWETLVEIGGADAQVHANVGAVLSLLDRPEEALRSLDHALSLDPDLEVARTGVEYLRETLRRGRK